MPRWAQWVLQRVSPAARASDVLGDLEETHRDRVRRRGRAIASVLTGIEALDMAAALMLRKIRGHGTVVQHTNRVRRATRARHSENINTHI